MLMPQQGNVNPKNKQQAGTEGIAVAKMQVQLYEIQQWMLAEQEKEYHLCFTLSKENKMTRAKIEKM